MKKIIITGGAGFIGSNLCSYLLDKNYEVTAIDNFDPYYNIELKKRNLKGLFLNPLFKFIEADIKEKDFLLTRLNGHYDAIIHLAAKAGVRYSLKYPVGYEEVNVQGTKRAIELSLSLGVKQFIFASSSSIYSNAPLPFSETFTNLTPVSPYAQTKLLSENLCKTYSETTEMQFIALRFFSVYGPHLRPDLVMHQLAESIYSNKPLRIFGDGNSSRDYTYIDDIIQGIDSALNYNGNQFEVFNLGNGFPIKLNDIINYFEEISGKKIYYEKTEAIKGESGTTLADNNKAKTVLGFSPQTNIKDGIKKYLNWFVEFYNI